LTTDYASLFYLIGAIFMQHPDSLYVHAIIIIKFLRLSPMETLKLKMGLKYHCTGQKTPPTEAPSVRCILGRRRKNRAWAGAPILARAPGRRSPRLPATPLHTSAALPLGARPGLRAPPCCLGRPPRLGEEAVAAAPLPPCPSGGSGCCSCGDNDELHGRAGDEDDGLRERPGEGGGAGVGRGRWRRLTCASGSGVRAAGARCDGRGSWRRPDGGAGRWRNGSSVGTSSIASMPISP
jgi:hypothetical protein